MSLPPFSASTPQATFTKSGKVKQTLYNFKDYGAKGDGVTDDTVAMNNTLLAANANGGGRVSGPPGNYIISAPLVIYSYTKLELDPAATITLAVGSNCQMIHNVGTTANRSTSDGAATIGTTTVTSATAAFTSADIGSTLLLGLMPSGAGIGGQTFCTTIASINSSSSVEVADVIGTSVSSTTLRIYRRDSYIEICGGKWDRGANGTNASINGNNFHVRHLDHFSIHDLYYSASGGKNTMSLGDITQYSVYNIELFYSGGIPNGGTMDGVHTIGPASHGYIANIKGSTNDDFVAFTAADAQSFNDVAGNIKSIDVNGMICNGAWNGLKMVGGTGVTIRDISVRGIHGTVSEYPVWINDDGFGPTDIDGITISDVDAYPSGSHEMFLITPSAAKTITLRNITYPSTNGGTAVISVNQGNGATGSIVSLVIDGLSIIGGTGNVAVKVANASIGSLELSHLVLQSSSATLNPGINVLSTGTVTNLTVSDVTVIQSTNQNNLVQNAGTMRYLTLHNIYMNGGMRLLSTSTGASALIAHLSDLKLVSVFDMMSIRTTVDLTMSNVYVTTTNTWLFSLISASAILSVRGSGLINPGNVAAILRDGSQTPRLVHPELQQDVSIIATNNGDMAHNTNSGLAPGAGKVIYNGASWEPLALPQDLYSTSSPTFAKLKITTGSNANAGTATLTGGTVTVSTTAVTANSLIFLTDAAASLTNVGPLSVTSKTAGTSFTVTSTNVLDTSTFNWLIIN